MAKAEVKAGTRWDSDLELLVSAARKAGAAAMTYFRKDPEVTWKNGGRSPVTEADFAANHVLADCLRPAREGYGWLSEESDDDPVRLTQETLFVIDPIDGTRGFIDGASNWVVSAAVVHAGRPVAGVLYAPVRDEVYTAVAGGSAFKNGEPLVIADPRAAGPLRISGGKDLMTRFEPEFAAGIARAPHVPSLAYRIAMIADGRIDATLVKPNAHDWDIAAAELILECAGGRLCDCDETPVIYNRADVSHGFLIGAANAVMPGLLRHFSPAGDS
jgi:myo-inositol-1(or 4)-monophosphatase